MTQKLRNTLNFLVPAQGLTQVFTANLPGDNTTGIVNDYTLDFRQTTQNPNIGGTAFIPQACTIDYSQGVAGTTVTFTIPSLGWASVIFAGQTATFQFPAVQDLLVTLTPSAGTPTIPTYWYNYPALPQTMGSSPALVTVNSLPAAPIGAATSRNMVVLAVQTTAGDHNIYVPGTRFVLERLEMSVLPTSTLAVAGINVLSIKDQTTIIYSKDVFVPAAAAANNFNPNNVEGNLMHFDINPYLSLSNGNNLIVNIGTAFTAGGVRVNAIVSG